MEWRVRSGFVVDAWTTFPQADVQVWEGMEHHPQRERIRPFCALVERVARAGEDQAALAAARGAAA